jgi:RES domain-containing protein
MIVFRLSKSKFANDLSGKGAEKTGGRWNSKGTSVVYTSESRALCTTEIAVHTPLGNLPLEYMLVTIEIPDDVHIIGIPANKIPESWKSFPHPHSTQEIGDKFVQEGKSAVLKVPSAVVQGDFNYIFNPAHPDAVRIKIKSIEPFNFDDRLFRKLALPF